MASLTPQEIRALVELLSTCNHNLSPTLQAVAVKLRGALRERGQESLSFGPPCHGQERDNLSLLPTLPAQDCDFFPTYSQADPPSPLLSEARDSPRNPEPLAPSSSPGGMSGPSPSFRIIASPQPTPSLKIHIPARLPRVPSVSGNVVEADDSEGNRQLVPKTSRRRHQRTLAARQCSRGGVKPSDYSARSKPAELGKEREDVSESESESEEIGVAAGDGHEMLLVPVPEVQFLASKPRHLLLEITTACNSIVTSKDQNPVSQLVDALLGHARFVGKDSITPTETSLQNLARRCCQADQSVIFSDFIYMLCTIQLRVGVIKSVCLLHFSGISSEFTRCREMKQTGNSRTQVLKDIRVESSTKTLARYFHDGAKYCLLAGAGTFYVSKLHSAFNILRHHFFAHDHCWSEAAGQDPRSRTS